MNIADHMNRDCRDKIKELIKKEDYTLFSAINIGPLLDEEIDVIAIDMDGYPFTCRCMKKQVGMTDDIINLNNGHRIVNLVAWKHIKY